MADGQTDIQQNLTIHDLDKGLLVAQIDEYLAKAMQDIIDPNKQATKKREVVIKIAFLPSKSRRDCQMKWNVDLKPSTHIERDTQTIYIARDKNGNAIAKPYVINQPDLPGVQDAIDAAEQSDVIDTTTKSN